MSVESDAPPGTMGAMGDAEVHEHWELDAYRPDPRWYLHDPGGIHGLGHAARVLALANRLARADAAGVDLEAVRWAAVLHDTRRHNDGRDPGHGQRAVAWIRSHARTILPESLPSTASTALTAEQVATIAYAVEWHVPPDHQAPGMTPELRCLKDADGLDRVRLGVLGDLDVRYLRTDLARALARDAVLLYRAASAAGGDPWTAARAAAISLGLWE